ncbi:MAG: T9SS type A sorting domain-containing protein [Bacteroidetes bacterium]|nr:T9SS type A sorting domain-containing protein [Bacteroidota bacterium]
MKKILFLVGSCGIISLLISIQHVNNGSFETFHKKPTNSGGSTPGKTGAPGEQNCTQCHSGTTQDGALENKLMVMDGTTPITNYVPGQQYTVTLQMTSNPAKKGFQATALTGTTAMAGTFTGQSGNTNINGTIKKYANHTSTSNTSTTAPIWTWTWTAPEAGTGNVTFYVASNKTNNNGMTSGDQIYLSQHIFSEASSAGIEENSPESVSVSFNENSNSIIANFVSLSESNTSLKLIDISGKITFDTILGVSEIGKNTKEIQLNKTLKSGTYIVTLEIGRKVYSKKIVI